MIESDFILFVMKNLNYIYMGLAFLMTTACSDNVADETVMGGDIQLGVTVGELQAKSRATAVPYLPQNEKTLTADVWFRNDGGGYEDQPDITTTNLPVHTTVTFEGTPMMAYVLHDGKNLKYPRDDSKVYCVGMYPATGWTATNNTTVSHDINGTEDLLFAPEIIGSWSQNFPTQQYEHLLTWIKINICASSHAAIDAWGTINRITVNSDSEVSVNLTTSEYIYSGSQEIATMTESRQLTTATREVGSVFCSPETEYTVTVNYTDKHGETKDIEVPLSLNIINMDDDTVAPVPVTDESQARGKCFVFSLYFTPYDVIEGVCTLNSWSNQNEDIYFNDGN